MKELLNIDIDLVRSFKRKGDYEQANKLIKIHQEQVKKAGREAYNNCLKKDLLIKQTLGLCTRSSCQEKRMIGHTQCEYHVYYKQEWARKNKHDNK